jgi:hypothetical protein
MATFVTKIYEELSKIDAGRTSRVLPPTPHLVFTDDQSGQHDPPRFDDEGNHCHHPELVMHNHCVWSVDPRHFKEIVVAPPLDRPHYSPTDQIRQAHQFLKRLRDAVEELTAAHGIKLATFVDADMVCKTLHHSHTMPAPDRAPEMEPTPSPAAPGECLFNDIHSADPACVLQN